MVRHYERKKVKGYQESDLLKAMDDVKNNCMTITQAAEVYGIPRTTIQTRMKSSHDRAGRPTVFSAEFEARMANCLHIMERNGFPLSRKEASILISEYVRLNGIVTPFKNDFPGKDWFQYFQKRNNLSIKKPQNVEIARRKACDPFVIYGYFDMLERVMRELDLNDKPKQIYNLDETSICNDPVKGKVVGKKGYPSTRTTSGPGRNNTSVLLATNAGGEKVPPLIVFQGKHLWSQWFYENENVNTAYAASEKGWMETSIFEQYMRETFVPAIGNERPILLLFDGHSTHVDLSVIEYAASEKITILKLPPHSSHILQPLDCSTMKPLKDRWEEEIIKWQRLHIGSKLPKNEFARILTKIWDEMNPVILQNGFRKAGAYPLNREAVRKEAFDILLLRKWEDFQTQQHQREQSEPEQHIETNEPSLTYLVPSLLSLALTKLNEDKKENPKNNSTTRKEESKKYKEPKETEKNTKQKTKLNEDKKENPKNYLTTRKEEPKKYKEPKENQKNTKHKTKMNEHKKENPKNYPTTRIEPKKYKEPKETEKNTKYKPETNLKTIQNPSAYILPVPRRFSETTPVESQLKVLEVKTVKPPNIYHENISFEALLLKTVAKNDVPVKKRKRISNNKAEIMTYKKVIERLKEEKEVKDKKSQNKLKRKVDMKEKEKNKTQKIPKSTLNKSQQKSRKQKKPVSEIDSNSTGSYKTTSTTDDEDEQDFFEMIFRESQRDEEGYNSTISDEGASTSTKLPEENNEKEYPRQGNFILAKFYSAKGKKTYKYVCLVESVTEEKVVVQGLKSIKKQKNRFRVVENDYSIIEYNDIVQYLPNPKLEDNDYIFPCKIEVLEL